MEWVREALETVATAWIDRREDADAKTPMGGTGEPQRNLKQLRSHSEQNRNSEQIQNYV